MGENSISIISTSKCCLLGYKGWKNLFDYIETSSSEIGLCFLCFRGSDIWSVKRIVEWRPCKWWLQGHLTRMYSSLIILLSFITSRFHFGSALFKDSVMDLCNYITWDGAKVM